MMCISQALAKDWAAKQGRQDTQEQLTVLSYAKAVKYSLNSSLTVAPHFLPAPSLESGPKL